MTMLMMLGAAGMLLAGKAMVMKKMGLEWWKALIPVYGDYVMFKKAKIGWGYIVTLVISGLGTLLSGTDVNGLAVVFSLYGVFATFLCCVEVTDRFHKSRGMAVGLALLPMVFYPILGFGDAIFDHNFVRVRKNRAAAIQENA